VYRFVVCHSGRAVAFRHFDAFDDEAGREARRNGKVTATLMEKSEPEISLRTRRKSTGSNSRRQISKINGGRVFRRCRRARSVVRAG
jgi:hypothetical protein